MTRRTERGFAFALLAACALVISGCGGGGDSTGPSTANTGANVATREAPTPLTPVSTAIVILSKCESLYERVYANTARRIRELGAVGSGASVGERRKLRAAEIKHEQALEFCEEENEINQVRGRREINIAATCAEPKSAVDKLRGELAADRLREFDQRRPVVCARVGSGEGNP